ncbi:MAG: TIGR03032 family protein [Magnetococcus sp. XQGC-1]
MAKKSPKNTIDTLWKRLRRSAVQPGLWLEMVRIYARHQLFWQAGYAARQVLRLDPNQGATLRALNVGSWQAGDAGDALLGRPILPEAADLVARFSAWLKQWPGDWLTWLYLARLGEMRVAVDLLPTPDPLPLQRAVALEFVPGETLHWLGVWRLNAGDVQGAVTALSALLDIRPIRCGSMMYLGDALLRSDRVAAAEKAFTRASTSNNPDFLLTLSARLYANNYWQEGIDLLEKALGLRPESLPILLALSNIYWEVYELSKAQALCQQIVALEPGNKEALYKLAALPGRMGDARGHLEAVQAEYAAAGDPLSRLASSILMAALYHDGLTPGEVADLHRRICAPIEAKMVQQTVFANPRTRHRRLRIGCVTGDLHRQHPVNIFMLPILLQLDRRRFAVHVYYTGSMHDGYTRRAEESVDGWVEAGGLDDAALQGLIQADGVDLLLDLAGHTASHRLGLFAMRAAPVQATFLGYPHSTGLTRMDWLIGDPVVSPLSQAHLFSEGLAQLPHSVFCWAPVDEYSLPPPRPATAPVVFGSFNNVMKLSPTTIQLWGRVLRAVPGSLLLLKAPALRDATVQARFTRLFAEQGIDAGRLILRGPSGLAEMMQEYGEMDIALDPTPYNGGTTTLQALWMGVPVVTLAGGNFVSRMGASFLHALGAAEWVAEDAEGYLRVAVALARDLPALRGGRAGLRARMSASPLCDIKGYVQDFENLLQRMWGVYCGGGRERLLSAGRSAALVQASVQPVPGRDLEISSSRQVLSWLAEQNLSLCLTTGHFGRLFLLGLDANGELSVVERGFDRCVGLAATENGFYLGTLYQVWRFENILAAGQQQEGYDRLYRPQVGHTTGELSIHELGVAAGQRLLFVNTLFGCLATLSDSHSFKPVWRPFFLSRLVAEDRCHLSGLAMREGRAAYVTAFADADVAGGWRDRLLGGGVVLDVQQNEVVARGLSMPHSPRWHQGRLWLLNAGTGELGYVDLESGRFVPLTFCAGYLRGLAFHGHFALVCLSLPRHRGAFSGWPLEESLRLRKAHPRCGVQVIDLRTGDAVHWLRLEGVVDALCDIITLPGVRRPMALGFKSDEIERIISVPGQ